MKDAASLILLCVAGAVSFLSQPMTSHPKTEFVAALVILAVLADFMLLTPWGETSTRVSPLVGLVLLFFGFWGFLAATSALLVGGLALCLRGKDHRALFADTIRSMGPLGAVSCTRLDLPEPFPTVALLLSFVFLSLWLEPRRYILRPSLLSLFCAPWLSLALYAQGMSAPWSLPLVLPLLLALSRGRDDAFPLLLRLRTALERSQEQAREESKKVQKLSVLLKAANLMAKSLESDGLRRALEQAARHSGAKTVKVVLPGESWSGPGQRIPLLDGAAHLCVEGGLTDTQRDHLSILARIFSTSWENVELHKQVVEALEETKRSQAKMVESSRMAAMGLLAAGIAHEVNTPLGAIQLSTELAEVYLEKKPEKVKKQLEAIFRATERAQKAVERTLYYVRPMGQEETELFAVAEVVEDALELLSHRIVRSQVSVQTDLAENITLHGERQSFFSLVFNLVLNAADAAVQSELSTVWVRCGATAESVVLEIEDSGPGIPEDQVEHIFEAFYTTKPSGEGTGLGLYLAQQAAGRFGGVLELRRGGQYGAVFRATLPRPS
jgi:signal transduction histidine kinase